MHAFAHVRRPTGGRRWVRTTAPSLVRPATTTPPPALTLVSPGQRQQHRAQPSSRKPRRAERAPICAPIRDQRRLPWRPAGRSRRSGGRVVTGRVALAADEQGSRLAVGPVYTEASAKRRRREIAEYGGTVLGACPWTTSEPGSACLVHTGRSRCCRWRHLGEQGASGICPVTAIKPEERASRKANIHRAHTADDPPCRLCAARCA